MRLLDIQIGLYRCNIYQRANKFNKRSVNKMFPKLLFAAIILFGSLSLTGCQDSKSAVAASSQTATPPSVVVARVQQKTVPLYGEFVGQIQAEASADIVARVEGVVKAMNFKEGQPVTKGQVLYQIDAAEYQAKVDSAKAALSKAESALKQAKEQTSIEQAKADLEQQKALLAKSQRDVARDKPLAASHAIAQQDLDAAISSEQVNEANVHASEARLQNQIVSTPAQIEQSAADVANDKASLTQAELNLSYCTIRAPFDGFVGRTKVYPGSLVSSAGTTVLNTVYAINPVQVTFGIPETGYLNIRKQHAGAKATPSDIQEFEADLILADESTYPFKGRYKLADSTIDQKTGTLTVVLNFPNPEAILRPNGFARVRLVSGKAENALLIPQKSVIEQQGGTAALIVGDDNKVIQRTVTLGPQFENFVIVTQGVKAGERVIVEGQQKARPGLVVSVSENALTAEAGK